MTREELQELEEWYNEYAHNDVDEYEEDDESLEEYERSEYYRNVLAPQIEPLNRR